MQGSSVTFAVVRASGRAGLILAIVGPVMVGSLHQFSFLPLTEGWWHVYAGWILEGRLPYADFELLVGPLYPLALAFLGAVGLDGFFALRVIGLIVIALISASLFYLMKETVNPLVAGLIAAISTVFLQLGVAYLSYDYVYVAILLLVLAGLCLRYAMKNTGSRSNWWLFSSGVLVSLTAQTKQSFGAVAFAVFLLAVLAVRAKPITGWDKFRLKSILEVFSFWMLGFVVGSAPLLIWAVGFSFLDDMWNDIVITGLGVKGGLETATSRWGVFVSEEFFFQSARTVVVTMVAGLLVGRFSARWLAFQPRVIRYGATLSLVLPPAILVFLSPSQSLADSLYLLAYGSAVLVPGGVFAFAFFRHEASGFLPLATVALSLSAGSIMSSGLGELSVFASLSLSLALVARLVANSLLSLFAGGMALVILMTFAIDAKRESPFAWWGLESSHAQEDPHLIDFGLAKGLSVDSQTFSRETEIASLLGSVSSCAGPHVAFPHVPRFHLDQDLISEGRLAVYWFDFSSGDEVLKEIERLQPKELCSLLVLDPPSLVWEGHEMLFGESRLMNHRAFSQVLQGKSRELDKVYYESLENGWTLSLYLTREKVE